MIAECARCGADYIVDDNRDEGLCPHCVREVYPR